MLDQSSATAHGPAEMGMDLDSLHRLTVSTASVNILRLVKGESPRILGINLTQTGEAG